MPNFSKCIRLAAGQAARDGGFTRRVEAGQSVYVKGWIRPQAGATSADIGIECDTEAGGSVALAVLNPTLPATNTWGAYEGYVEVPAGKVWSRPYMKANGGAIDFAELFIAPAAETHRVAPFAINDSVSNHTAGVIGPFVATALVLGAITIVTEEDEVPVVEFGCDVSFTGTASSFLTLARSTNGGVETITAGGQATIAAANGHAQHFSKVVRDTLAPAGSHTYTWYCNTGGSKTFSNRLISAGVEKR